MSAPQVFEIDLESVHKNIKTVLTAMNALRKQKKEAAGESSTVKVPIVAPKTKKTATPKVVAVAQTVDEVPAKKGRGRPRKTPLPL
jgi:hypothetical protein